MRPATFPIFVLGALLLFGALQWRPPAQDPFTGLGDGDYFQFRNALAIEISNAKIAHARFNSRYRVGLFGNSGQLVTGTDDIGLAPGDFFNFSIGGGSLRHSVAMIEALDRLDKVPETILVTLDHIETQFIGNAHYPPPPRRWWNVARDVAEGLRRSASFQDIRFTVERSAIIEWSLFQKSFSYNHMRRSLADWFPNIEHFVITDPSSPGWVAGYTKDGSRLERTRPSPLAQVPLLGERPRLIIQAYLDYDLERLARIAERTGARVIIFESLIEFASAEAFAAAPSPYTPAIRERFLEHCSNLGLECYPSPNDLATLHSPVQWASADHPPADLLGRYLSRLLHIRQESP